MNCIGRFFEWLFTLSQLWRLPSCQRSRTVLARPYETVDTLIVLFHGIGSGPGQLEPMARYISSQYPHTAVVCPRYMTSCTTIATDLSFHVLQATEVVLEWMDHFRQTNAFVSNDRRVFLGGASFGGVVAMMTATHMAAQYPGCAISGVFTMGAPHGGISQPMTWFHWLGSCLLPNGRRLLDQINGKPTESEHKALQNLFRITMSFHAFPFFFIGSPHDRMVPERSALTLSNVVYPTIIRDPIRLHPMSRTKVTPYSVSRRNVHSYMNHDPLHWYSIAKWIERVKAMT